MAQLEIERKFLIAMPDASWLLEQKGVVRAEIAQTYLRGEPGEEVRVRRKAARGAVAYVKTVKRAVLGAVRQEDEREISCGQYEALLSFADPARHTIEKTRYSFPYAGQVIEIDVYPFWKDRAILEIELVDERQEIHLPREIDVLQEVTDDPRYKNAALAGNAHPERL